MARPLKNMENTIIDDVMLLDEKDLVMSIICLQHLENANSFNFGTDVLVSTISTVSTFLVDAQLSKLILATFSAAFITKLVVDLVEHFKINKFKDILVTELLTRFETPQMAYLEVSRLVLSTTREEIIEYLNKIGCGYNEVK